MRERFIALWQEVTSIISRARKIDIFISNANEIAY